MIALVPCLLLTGPALIASGGDLPSGGRYFPASSGFIAVWCGAEGHPVVPRGDPEDYPSEAAWLFSGEPECAHADRWNDAREMRGKEREETGWGGFLWFYERVDLGRVAEIWAEDVFWGPDVAMRLEAGRAPEEGCGARSVTLQEPDYHFPPQDPPGAFPLWAVFRPVGVDADLAVCGATTGSVWAALAAV